MIPLRLMLFDLAGTLIEDEGRVLRLYGEMIADHDLAPRTRAQLLALMGCSKRDVFINFCEGDLDRAQELIAEFEARLHADFAARPARPLPHARKTLAHLRMLGIEIAYTTGFSRAIAERIVRDAALDLSFGAASDEVERGRPAPDLIHLAMDRAGLSDPGLVGTCGDTPGDLLAGTAARCTLVIGVGNGTHPLARLQDHPHTHLLETLADFPWAQIAAVGDL